MSTIRYDKVCNFNYHDLSTNGEVFGKSFFIIFEALLVCRLVFQSRSVFRTICGIVDAYHKTIEICNSLFHFYLNDTLNVNNCVLEEFKVDITMKYLCFR